MIFSIDKKDAAAALHSADGTVVTYGQLREIMEQMKGIYCTCIGRDTLDEAPFAYRGLDEIKEAVGETLQIRQILKPVYNFKAGGR